MRPSCFIARPTASITSYRATEKLRHPDISKVLFRNDRPTIMIPKNLLPPKGSAWLTYASPHISYISVGPLTTTCQAKPYPCTTEPSLRGCRENSRFFRRDAFHVRCGMESRNSFCWYLITMPGWWKDMFGRKFYIHCARSMSADLGTNV